MEGGAQQVQAEQGEGGRLQQLHQAVQLDQRLQAHGQLPVASHYVAHVLVRLHRESCVSESHVASHNVAHVLVGLHRESHACQNLSHT